MKESVVVAVDLAVAPVAAADEDDVAAAEEEDQHREGSRRREWIGGSGPPAKDFAISQ